MPPSSAAMWPKPAQENEQRKLANEFDAGRAAAAPDHLTFVPGAGVARKGEPQGRGQRGGLVEADFGTGAGDILHHALARSKAAVERDPRRLAHQFARFTFLRCRHDPLFPVHT